MSTRFWPWVASVPAPELALFGPRNPAVLEEDYPTLGAQGLGVTYRPHTAANVS